MIKLDGPQKARYISFILHLHNHSHINLYSVCICPCVHECVYAHVCCVQACRAQFSILGIFQCLLPLLQSTLTFETGYLTEPRDHLLARLDGQQAQGVHMSPRICFYPNISAMYVHCCTWIPGLTFNMLST